MDALEKAIEILNDTEADMKYTSNEINFAHLLAIKMIKKQIPKRVGVYPSQEFKHCCPTCGTPAISDHEKYCSECGQAISWEESE